MLFIVLWLSSSPGGLCLDERRSFRGSQPITTGSPSQHHRNGGGRGLVRRRGDRLRGS